MTQDIDDLIKRLEAVVNKVTGNSPSDVHMGMRVPANKMDVDLICSEAATTLREQQERIAQDSQCLISYQHLLEEAGCPPSSTDIIEAWKTAKIAKIEEQQAELDELRMQAND